MLLKPSCYIPNEHMPFFRITPPFRHLTSVVIFLCTLLVVDSHLPAAPKPDSTKPAPSPTPSSDSSGETTMSSRLIQREIGDQLARMLLGGEVKDGDTVVADARLMSADDVTNAVEFGAFGGEKSGLELRLREG